MISCTQGVQIKRLTTIVVALLFGLLMGLAASPVSASAQGGEPAICDEYPNLPDCGVGPGGNGGENPDDGIGHSGDAGRDGDGGDLPFTGYPLTPLLTVLLGLLAIGLLLRFYLALRARVQARNAAAG